MSSLQNSQNVNRVKNESTTSTHVCLPMLVKAAVLILLPFQESSHFEIDIWVGIDVHENLYLHRYLIDLWNSAFLSVSSYLINWLHYYEAFLSSSVSSRMDVVFSVNSTNFSLPWLTTSSILASFSRKMGKMTVLKTKEKHEKGGFWKLLNYVLFIFCLQESPDHSESLMPLFLLILSQRHFLRLLYEIFLYL